MQNTFWLALGLLALYLFMRPSVPAEARMSPQTLRGRMAEEAQLQLVDVRSPAEFSEGHLKGAKNIPLDELQGRVGELSKDKAVALYCRSGARSGRALSLLLSQGFKAQHLEGGILAWQREGLPL